MEKEYTLYLNEICLPSAQIEEAKASDITHLIEKFAFRAL